MKLPLLPLEREQLEEIGAAAFAVTAGHPFPDRTDDPVTLCTNRLAMGITAWAVTVLPPLPTVQFTADRLLSGHMMLSLSGRLRRVIGQIWLAELEIFRAGYGSVWNRLATLGNDQAAHQTLRQFFDWLYQSGFRSMLAAYPLLAPALCNTIQAWWQHICRFLLRLDRDSAVLSEFLDMETVSAVQPVHNLMFDMGDLHHGGETVSGVRFSDRHAAVLKPRDGASDLLWWQVVQWVNATCGEEWLSAPRVLPMEGYVWTEYVRPQPCETMAGIGRFYRRAGRLLALCHVMGMGDLHHENVIAAGEFPVIVDTETLLSPQRHGDRSTAGKAAHAFLARSILRLGMLPHWQPVGEDGWWDSASLGTGESPGKIRRSYVGRTLSPDEALLSVTMTGNVPVLDGRYYGADGYVAEIGSGFAEMQAHLSSRRNHLTSLVMRFLEEREVTARVILRHTLQYSTALEQAAQPGMFQDESVRQRMLTPPLTNWQDEQEVAACVQSAEFAALSAGDIPLFRVSCQTNRLTDPASCAGLPLSGYDSGLSAFRQRLAETGQDQGWFQRLIRWSFEGRVAIHPAHKKALAPEWPEVTPANPARLLAEAVRIGTLLLELSVAGEDGSLAWVVPSFADDGSRYGIRPANETLYIGRTGIALFLANLARVTGDPRFRAAALSSIHDLDSQLRTQIRVMPLACGMPGGYGSIIFAGAEIARLLDEPPLLTAIARVVESADWSPVLASGQAGAGFDMLGGRSGLLLALIALWQRTAHPWLLTLLRRTADVVAEATLQTGGHVIMVDDHPMTGLSHGNAGVAHALRTAHAATGIARYATAADLAISVENSFFNNTALNWQDKRPGGSSHGMVAWCNGASGIGLSRLHWLSHAPQGFDDVEAALTRTLRFPPGGTQHLCCGDAGRLLFLWRAGILQKRPALCREAVRRATWLMERARRHGGRYVLSFGEEEGSEPNPSLFRGIAGPGWAFLEMTGHSGLSDPLLGLPGHD